MDLEEAAKTSYNYLKSAALLEGKHNTPIALKDWDDLADPVRMAWVAVTEAVARESADEVRAALRHDMDTKRAVLSDVRTMAESKGQYHSLTSLQIKQRLASIRERIDTWRMST